MAAQNVVVFVGSDNKATVGAIAGTSSNGVLIAKGLDGTGPR